ncbi:hypothetical protein [Allostreptomyces psammosilenae]|uniref:ABC-type phosphate transport system substrate-binding protein n=1 Tax=Allostreptomyces psammosilenae TaxID=1892865 RepID=A0A852ZV61_9ACTN|nr:hypothetical protein [Allostreptomyces psammosilenae]NYI06283.1 ABC-type phosphate transport system substrate-binding protein [Allostreptomyces psammosilenae]
MRNKLVATLAAGAAALTLAVGTAGTATADPTGYRPVAGVGSDTTQDVLNALGTVVGGGTVIGSYNATGSATIDTKSAAACQDLPRPNGSSAGIDALIADTAGCLDFARSSRGVATAGTNLTFIPFATDRVTYIKGSGVSSSLTTAQLTSIYDNACTSGYTVYLPQAGSGTRSFWLSSLGLTEAQVETTSEGTGCVVDTVQEHDGTVVTQANGIAPFSRAQWTAQSNSSQTGVADRRGTGTSLGSITFSRPVYNVVKTNRLGETTIRNTFVGSSSAVCTAIASDPYVALFGFTARADCGSVATTGNR